MTAPAKIWSCSLPLEQIGAGKCHRWGALHSQVKTPKWWGNLEIIKHGIPSNRSHRTFLDRIASRTAIDRFVFSLHSYATQFRVIDLDLYPQCVTQNNSLIACRFWNLDRRAVLIDIWFATHSKSYWAFLNHHQLHRFTP